MAPRSIDASPTMRPGRSAVVTTTLNVPVAVFPLTSAVEHATAVVPIGKVLPVAGVQDTGRVPSTRSVADALKLTDAPDEIGRAHV